MNHFILIFLLSLLSLIWPLSVVHANSCCGGHNVGIGGNIQSFEVPPVYEFVPVNEFTLKVNRVKWSIQREPVRPLLTAAIFSNNDTTIRAFHLPPLAPSTTLRDLASTNAPVFSQMHFEKIRTSFGVSGVKASYGGTPNLLSQNLQLIRYYFPEKSGQILCFEVRPMKKFVNWSDANDLILDTLRRTSS
jgi:hypothetical protein